MRLRIEATEDELATRPEDLVKALAHALEDVAPDIADELEKAVPHTGGKSQLLPAMRELNDLVVEAYDKRLKWMLRDIGKVLDRAVMKKAEGDEPPDPGDPPPEKLEPGDVDPETGEEVPQPKEKEPKEGEESTE